LNPTGSEATPGQGQDAQLGSRPEPAAISEGAATRLGQARWLVAVCGLVAGLVAFGVGEAIYKVIPPASVEQNISGNKVMLPDRDTNIVASTKNGALAFGVLGLCLGGFLGMAGGQARRSTPASLTAGLLGSALGFVLGGGLSLALLPSLLRARYYYSEYDIAISLAMHALIWGLLGAFAGLAFAVGLGERRLVGRAFTAGLVGAVLGAVVYELIGAVFFPAADTDEPISESWPTRLLARLLVAGGTAAALVLLRPATQPLEAVHRPETPTPSLES
jgi:hypothetical protein